MKAGRFGTVLLPLLVSMLILGIGAVSQAGEQGWLGVMLQPRDEDIKEAMELDEGLQGVLISDVVDDSPAEEHGLEDGDIIIMIGGEKVVDMQQAIDSVKKRTPGEEVDVVVLRDGDKKKVMVKLGTRPKEYDVEKKIKQFEYQMPPMMGHMPDFGHGKCHMKMEKQAFLGVKVMEISKDLGEYFDVDPREGVLVLEVVCDSPAEDADLKAGDVILELDGKNITSPDRLVKYIGKSEPGDEMEVTYKRKRRTRTVTVELDSKPMEDAYWMQKGHAMCMCGDPGCGGACMGKGHGEHKCVIKTYGKCPGCGQKDCGDPKCGGGKKHKCIIMSPGKGVCKIQIPEIDIDLEDLDLDDLEDLDELKIYGFDSGELKKELEELKKELEELKKELKKMKK